MYWCAPMCTICIREILSLKVEINRVLLQRTLSLYAGIKTERKKTNIRYFGQRLFTRNNHRTNANGLINSTMHFENRNETPYLRARARDLYNTMCITHTYLSKSAEWNSNVLYRIFPQKREREKENGFKYLIIAS